MRFSAPDSPDAVFPERMMKILEEAPEGGAAMKKPFFSSSAAQATLIGLTAPLCWGMSVSLVRGIAEGYGMAVGQCILYCVSSVFLYFIVGFPNFRTMDRRYLWIGIPTANACSLCFCLAIFFAADAKQTMEAAMINYLWPSLTLLFAVLFNGVKARWWLWPGLVVAFGGVTMVLSGADGFSLSGFAARVASNPIAYLFALGAAVTWAAFSSMTKAWGGSHNPSLVIFLIDATIYGVLWLMGIGTEAKGEPSLHGMISVILGGCAMGCAYAAWTHGVAKGSVMVLAAASYFTPVLSCLFAVFWIGAELDAAFWRGVLVIVAGSLLCWDASGRGVKAKERRLRAKRGE